MTEQEETRIFELLTSAGGAKSAFMEALYKAKEGDYDGAQKLMEEGENYFVEAHHAHADMIADEGNGVEMVVRLVLAHAEDQLMSAELTKTMAEEIIALYKRLDAEGK
ncbi:MAG: PTS lactose/cellobiose transporter subunit IIA [Oscillospiraceae bacterium]|nr:PTS lactose/cellobiose transporter subunit IIA [Oscillospiraceae bacterium]